MSKLNKPSGWDRMKQEQIGAPVNVKVKCFNEKDGCESVVIVSVMPGSRIPRKLCMDCKVYGTPSERGYIGYVEMNNQMTDKDKSRHKRWAYLPA